MSYMLDLDEYSEAQLQGELDRRKAARDKGLCDYCGNGRHESMRKYLQRTGKLYARASDGPCKFPERHGEIYVSIDEGQR